MPVPILSWLLNVVQYLIGTADSGELGTHDEPYLPQAGAGLNGKYQEHHMLGSGMYSKTRLVRLVHDSKTTFFAAKILTADATREHDEKRIIELEAMQRLRSECDSPLLPTLVDDFRLHDADGRLRICMVMNILGSDVGTFRRTAPEKSLPHYIVRTIMRQVIEALALLHAVGIVHTDLKPDNILFRAPMDADGIDSWRKGVPDDGHPHPLPNSFSWDCTAEQATKIEVTLIDLGQCQWAGVKPTVDQFSAFSLRAPEVILQSDFGTALDIWAVGCLTFELISGRWLFHPEAGETWTSEDDHLAKILEFTGSKTFPADMRARAKLRDIFFNTDGSLKNIDELFPVSIEEALGNYTIVPREQVGPAAAFVRRCLVVDPNNRPSAAELLTDPWLKFPPTISSAL